MPSVRAQYGALVKHHRERKGLTQAQLAERTERSLEMIGRIERGNASPSFATIEAIARVLNTPLKDFFSVGEYAVKASDDRLALLMKRLAGLSREDLEWADRLLSVALHRKQPR